MNILKRQLALLLVLAMTLTMLPMPTHADEVTDSESPSAIVEETTEQAVVSSEEDSTNTANSPVENAEPDTTAKENTVPAVETPVDTAVGSDATITEELIEDVSESDPKEEPEEVINTDDTTDDTEVEENTDSDLSVDCEEDSNAADIEESEILEASEDNTQEETEQMESELEAPVAMTFSLNRSAVNAAADCAHENTTVTADPREEYWYNLHTDTTKHVANHYIRENCDDCGETVSEVHNYFAEDHVMNENSVCTLCGYTEETASCAHSETEVAWDTNHTITYTPVDATQHKATGYQYTYCTSCFERVGESIAAEEYEEHSLNTSGKCSLCGYQSSENTGCTHENTETAWDTTQPIYYSIYSATQHQIRGFEYTYCNSCFERIGESSWSQQLEDHTLDANGVCDLCSYGRNTCAHENVVFGYAPVYDPPRYEQYNETQHFVYHIMQKSCRDCGEKLSDGEEAGSLEDHVLDDGKCTYCGYGLGENYCTHPDTDIAWDTNYSITYTKIDNNEELTGILHQAEGYQYHYCTSCYKRICDSFPVAEWENHIFDAAGDCTLCNYRVGCEHKQTTMKLYDTLYESLNKDSHEVTRLYSKVCADPDCGKVLVSVETSYTETDIEDHDFTGNTCLLCNYTVADQLSATVTASVLTANKGDNISATVSVVGGTGGYRFSWKILKDGSVVVENPITTSASCGTNAYEEGSYVFQVTVTDSGGNTVTAQSGAITVSHGCQYVTVSNTVLVNQSLTHHTVETTTYEECTICHEKRNEVTDVEWVEHTPIDAESYGHEAAHPHKKYFICECGAHPYLDGEYHTANGEVQDESVCCICHDHKYGAEAETDEGTRQKTCINCGLTTVTHAHEYKLIQTEKFINPDETKHYVETTSTHKCKTCGHEKPGITVTIDEPHSPKNPKDYTYRTAHPHQRYAVCECGKEFNVPGEYEKVNGKLLEPDVCCICHGHKFGEPTVGYGGDLYQTCKNCYFTEIVTAPTEPEEEICNHVYSLEGDGTKHPHEIKRVCMRCKAEESYKYTFFDCCQCVGHDWSEVVRLPDGKTYQIGCYRCKETQKVKPSSQIENFYGIVDIITERHDSAKQYQEEHEIDSVTSAIWKTIAGQAADILTDVVFVATNEALDAASSAYNVVSVQKEVAETFIDPETWDEQQTEIWKSLIVQMLQTENELEDVKSYVDETEFTKDFVSDGKKVLKAFDLAGSKQERLGILANVVGVLAEGANNMAVADEYNKTIAELRVNEKNIDILQEIMDAAYESENANLYNAAFRLQNDIKEANEQATDQLINEGYAFLTGFADKGLQWAVKEFEHNGIKAVGGAGALKILAVVTIAGRATDLVLGWGPIYDEAQMLMTLNVMDANMNIANVLKTEDSPYMAKLWGVLQVEGCNHAQELLNAVEDARDLGTRADFVALATGSPALMTVEVWKHIFGINLEDDFGIDEGGLFGKDELPDVLKDLDKEREYHIDELELLVEASK